MKTPFEYYAFISYKREDEKWANWLQRKIEYYKLPAAVRKNNPSLPKIIRPVFKDTTDLEPGLLAKKIKAALDSSKFLIVICSPRSAGSIWVGKEVQEFIDSGRADHIIPFIIGGTPNATDSKEECFPEGLRRLAGDQELLGANINEMGRDAAAIKVVAQMFNLRFDSLWQRYERQKRIRNIFVGIAAILAFMAAATILSLYVDRNSAYKSLEEKNLELTKAYSNLESTNQALNQANENVLNNLSIIKQTNDSLDKINTLLISTNVQLNEEKENVTRKSMEALREQMRLIASHGEGLYKEGRILPAFRYVRSAAKKIISGEYPYSPEIASLLNKIKWHLTSDFGTYKLIDRANLTDDFYNEGDFFVSSDGRYNVYASAGRFYIYDFHTQKTSLLPYEGWTVDINVQFSDSLVFFSGREGYGSIWNHIEKKIYKDEINWEYDDEYVLPGRKIIRTYNRKTIKEHDEAIADLVEDILNYNELHIDSEKDVYIKVTDSGNEIFINDFLFSKRKIELKFPPFSEVHHLPKTKLLNSKKNYIANNWNLIDRKNASELYAMIGEYNDDDDEIPYIEDVLLYKNTSTGVSKDFNPFIAYNTGNGIEYLHTAFIISDSEILCLAGQGNHIIYNVNSEEKTQFQNANLDAWIMGHPGVCLSGAIVDSNNLYDIRACGQITLYDIPTRLVIDEYESPQDNWLGMGNFVMKIVGLENNILYVALDNNKIVSISLDSKIRSLADDIEAIDSFWRDK